MSSNTYEEGQPFATILDNPDQELKMTPGTLEMVEKLFNTVAEKAEQLQRGTVSGTASNTSIYKNGQRYGLEITISIGKIDSNSLN